MATKVKIVHPRPLVMRLEFADGIHLFTHGGKPNFNSSVTSKIARDKDLTVRMLDEVGIPTPTSHFVWLTNEKFPKDIDMTQTDEFRQLQVFAQRVGFPIFLKPNQGSQGKDVFCIRTQDDLRNVTAKLLKQSPGFFIAQEACIGDEYRIVVVHGEIVLAYTRMPLSVIGDGQSTIKQLIQQRLQMLQRQGREVSLKPHSEKIKLHLEANRLTLNTIPDKGSEISVVSNRNLSDGSDPVECTDAIKQKYAPLCRDIYKKCGVEYCGLDLIEDTRTGSIKPFIIEINSNPGYKHFIRSAPENAALVRRVFEHVITALHLKSQLNHQAARPTFLIISNTTPPPPPRPALLSEP
ncbi:MAG: hypothetical protein K2Q32_01310 [Alphaproteobacteria bacterium]|nr:hypothetical protein [Alphaproteobacteria bacterium]